MKRIILIIADSTTYHTAPRGLQANNIINYLAGQFKIILITSTNSVPDNGEYFSKDIEVYSTKSISNRVTRLFSMFMPFLSVFDPVWSLRSRIKLKKLISDSDIQIHAILTFSLKYSSVIVASRIREKIDPSPQIASFFSDPLSFNKYLYRNKLQKWILTKIEKRLLSKMDYLVVPSLFMKDKYSKITNDHSIKYIPHAFVPLKETGRKVTNKGNENIIRHIGSLYKLRSPMPLINHILEFEQYYSRNSYIFEFVGRIGKDIRKQIRSIAGLPDIIRIRGSVSQKESYDLMQSADILLLIDADIEESTFLPSKLVEYLSFNKFIIGITPENSETERVLNLTGNKALHYNELDKLPAILENIPGRKHKPEIDFFSINNVVQMWVDLISEMN